MAAQSRSVGLLTPRLPRFRTFVYIIVGHTFVFRIVVLHSF
jgi:hypothetical protein